MLKDGKVLERTVARTFERDAPQSLRRMRVGTVGRPFENPVVVPHDATSGIRHLRADTFRRIRARDGDDERRVGGSAEEERTL